MGHAGSEHTLCLESQIILFFFPNVEITQSSYKRWRKELALNYSSTEMTSLFHASTYYLRKTVGTQFRTSQIDF